MKSSFLASGNSVNPIIFKFYFYGKTFAVPSTSCYDIMDIYLYVVWYSLHTIGGEFQIHKNMVTTVSCLLVCIVYVLWNEIEICASVKDFLMTQSWNLFYAFLSFLSYLLSLLPWKLVELVYDGKFLRWQ